MRRFAPGIALILLPFLSNLAFADADLPADWPEGWKTTYARFEKFIEAQRRFLPPSGLEILPDGTIEISSPKQTSSQTSLAFFSRGREILSTSGAEPLFGQGRQRLFAPGEYAAFVFYVAESLGYQTLYPFLWFRVDAGKKESLVVRPMDAPEPPEDFWPNERLQRFLDFHCFGKNHRNVIFRRNARISPAVELFVTPDGIIRRSSLAPSLEKHLRWRIYLNGRLVERGSAAETKSLPETKSGSYVAIIGVEGPGGFLPVSNFLTFPLFPKKGGGVEVLPTVTNPQRVPDFLLEIIPPEVLSEVFAQDWGQGGGYYNPQLIYVLSPGYRRKDPKKQALLSLWHAWGWELGQVKASPDSDLSHINLLLDPP